MKRPSGFTLIELLIVITLVSVISMSLYAMFGSGIGLMRRVSGSEMVEDISLFLEKFDREVASQVLYKGIPFEGQETFLSFSSRLDRDKRSPVNKGIGRVSYAFDDYRKALVRKQENMSQLYKKEDAPGAVLVEGVSEMKYQYLVYDKGRKVYEWMDTWDSVKNGGQVPAAVKLRFECSREGERHVFERTVAIPVADITR